LAQRPLKTAQLQLTLQKNAKTHPSTTGCLWVKVSKSRTAKFSLPHPPSLMTKRFFNGRGFRSLNDLYKFSSSVLLMLRTDGMWRWQPIRFCTKVFKNLSFLKFIHFYHHQGQIIPLFSRPITALVTIHIWLFPLSKHTIFNNLYVL
jgi:hypothetical protein